jgi:hypothetical protein
LGIILTTVLVEKLKVEKFCREASGFVKTAVKYYYYYVSATIPSAEKYMILILKVFIFKADGSVRVDYLDSSALLVRSKSASVDYYQPGPADGQGE